MPRIVIADTSFLIAIQKMHLFDEIQDLYHQIYITKKIEEEFQFALPDWILIQEPLNITIQAVLSLTLDPGEASAIALAYSFDDVILIIDDLKARKEAIALGFKITGTLGVLFKLKEKGLINSLKQKVLQLAEIGFRINPKIIEEILRNAGEE
jgi:predicted nucleic acid-binding protein